MAILGKLILLGIVCTVASQNEQDERVIPTLNYEHIAKIVRAPLFRSSLTDSSADGTSSYLPVSYDNTPHELSESQVAGKSLLAPMPSLTLEVPKPGAVDSYSGISNVPVNSYSGIGDAISTVNPYLSLRSVPESTQIYQTYKPSPLIAFKPSYVQPTFTPQLKPLPLNYPIKPQVPLTKYVPTNPHSKQLDLPLPSAPNYPPVPSSELQTPILQFNPIYNTYGSVASKNLDPIYPPLNPALQAHKSESIKPLHTPTNLFPKKYNSNVHEYKPKKVGKSAEIVDDEDEDEDDDDEEEDEIETPVAKSKPEKYSVAPLESKKPRYDEKERLVKLEKQRQKFDEAQKKLLAKKENGENKQQRLIDATIARAKGDPVASASGFNTYQEEGPQNSDGGLSDVSHGATGERTDFQMYGQHGPNSYKFGYDTGKGHNRQFRYEERDNDGYVKGHYGFYDKHGRLQVVNYDAHPHHGFHAEGSFV